MADSTSNLDLISSAQAGKETTSNALSDAASTATLYGRRASTCSGLTWGFYGGKRLIVGVPTTIANGTLALTLSTTNYIRALDSTGAVSFVTSIPASWPAPSGGYTPLYEAVTSATLVTSYTDWRTSSVSGTPTIPAQPYVVPAEFNGLLTASYVLRTHVFSETVTFPASLTGSYGIAILTATAQADIDILKSTNSGVSFSSVGTTRYAIAATTSSFIMASQTVFSPGHVMQIVAPASADATLGSIAIALRGTRPA